MVISEPIRKLEASSGANFVSKDSSSCARKVGGDDTHEVRGRKDGDGGARGVEDCEVGVVNSEAGETKVKKQQGTRYETNNTVC